MSILGRDQSARDLACSYHARLKYGKLPFVVHLLDVVQILHAFYSAENLDPQILKAAWLHDILEDTEMTPALLKLAGFSPRVIALVQLVTDEEGKNRAERKAKTYPKTATDNDAITIKLADRIANIQRTLDLSFEEDYFRKEYLKEYPDFKAALYKGGSCAPITENMWRYLDLLMEELRKTCPSS